MMAISLILHGNCSSKWLILLFIVYMIINVTHADTDCLAGNYNLTPLSVWNIWHIKTKVAENDIHFFINPCGSLQKGLSECNSATTSVCMNNVTENTYSVIGNVLETIDPHKFENEGGFRLDFRGSVCPTHTGLFYNTSINFKCGNSLGSPVLLESSECSFIFEWHSTVACDRVDHPAVEETRCYLYDNKDRKHDLTPLVKQSSGYLAITNSDYDFYINVCRNIQPAGPTSKCPQEAAACRVNSEGEDTAGAQAYNMGSTIQRELVHLDNDHYSIYYEHTDKTIPGCNGHSPSTTITFVCPREGVRLGESRSAVVISDFNCQFHVEWQTEYACETEMLTSDSCVLDSGQYGIDIDLRPLKKRESEIKYKTQGNGYKYFLNVCDKACNSIGGSPGVCQLQLDNDKERNAGSFSSSKLRYVDGELSLTYKGGDPCSSGFERTSVITFKCSETVEGSPKFITETSCTYFFEWSTRYACHEHPTCQLAVGDTQYDLESLEREGGNNWVALNSNEDENGMFLINVCGNILRDDSTNAGAANCNPEAAVCYIDRSKVVNVGSFKKSPVFEDEHLKLKYIHGDPCDNKKQKSAVITFSCSPGDLESAPVFIRMSDDECLYEFEWRTAAACPPEKAKGHDCVVYDNKGGFSFDLTPLKGFEYQANVTDSKHEYDYFIRVCEPLQSSHCGTATNVGACQSKKSGGSDYVTGKINSNSTLEYYDGILKLTYYNGDDYNTRVGEKVQSRRTEIVFLCDPNGVNTRPIYTSEGNYTYFFEWYTKYACPSEPVECIVRKGNNQQYDLTSLSASKALDDDNWSIIDDTVEGHRYKFYIHVCKPLNPVAGCDALSSSCMVEIINGKEKPMKSNLGFSRTPPVIESVGHVKLTYTNGNKCKNDRLSETRIHFICVEGAMATSPRLLEKIEDCDYVFEWKTEAACPITKSEGASNCTVEDANSGYIFNLNPLKKKDKAYSVVNGTSTFKINICGNVPSEQCNGNSNAGACQINQGNNVSVLGQASSRLTFTDDGHLSLVYKSPIDKETGESNMVEITFLCRHEVSGNHHELTFLRKDGQKWLFNFETPHACLPQAVDCLISDSHGNEYDLTPLAKEDGNWEVVDTTEGSSHLTYHINVCRPLNNNRNYNCPGGAIGSCQTDTTGGKPHNLGYVQSMPEAAPDGSVSIQYENGDLCKDGVRYSTRIMFECSDRPGSPVFQVDSNDCEYVFSWQTPAACPLKSDKGTNCIVNDPELGFQFNLSSLHNPKEDYIVEDGDYKYRINPCGSLVGGDGNCNKAGVGACQTKPSDSTFSKITGMSNTNLVYEGGRFKLNYTNGDKCHNNVYERSTAFIFYCDKQTKSEPKFIQETTDCTYIFEWPTPLACPPFDLVQCSYRNSTGTQFDLSALTRTHDNYKIIQSYNTKGTQNVYYINVCRPLVHSDNVEGSKCPGNSAACLKTGPAENPIYFDLGHLSGPPTMKNNNLRLTYEGGDICRKYEGSDEVFHKKTTIAFICDEDAEATGPQYAFSSDDCFYNFNWFTELACGLMEEKVTNDCTVINPATGYRYDLSSLSKDGGYEVSSTSYIYKLNICGALRGSACGDDISDLGVCQEQPPGIAQHPYDAGRFNKRLSFDDGILMLNYEGGKPCHQAQFNRSSIIYFVCPHAKDYVVGEPVFVDESQDCTYYFSWHTSLACENQISCIATNGINSIDLSPLVNERGYYLAVNADPSEGLSAIYLNPCRPLNPIPGIRCPPNAAGCVAQEGKASLSIGKMVDPPSLSDNGTVTLTYTNGSSCPEKSEKKLKTIIQFVCDPGTSDGTPKLTSSYDCTYRFIWMTSHVCSPSKPETGKETEDCKYTATNLDYTFDLTPLSAQVENVEGGYAIHICKPVSDSCKGAVCFTSSDGQQKSLGSVSSQVFSYDGHNLKVTYSDGDSCPSGNGKRQTEIIFECDASLGRGKPVPIITDDEACYYSFVWRTNLVCPLMHQPCDVEVNGEFYDLHALSRATSSWQVSTKNKKFYLNVCTSIKNGPSKCDEAASVCSELNDVVDNLGMEYTQQLTAKKVLTVTDVQMVFSGGHSELCPGKSVGAKISFLCGKTIGAPVYEGLNESKFYCENQFSWKTRVACPEEIVSVEERNGKFTDPHSNQVIDIHELKSKQQIAEEKRQETIYKYYISLNGEVNLPEGNRPECKGAAICQTDPSKKFYRNIGSTSMKKFYMSDDTLEMVVTSPDSCHKGGDVNSTIIFQCDKNAGLGSPTFQYESIKCHYFFTWNTDRVCTTTSIGSTSLSSKVGGSHKTSIVIAVFATLIIICCLGIYFHDHDRRSSFAWSIKKYLPGGYSNIPSYKYTKLSSEEGGKEDEASLLEDVTPKHGERQHNRDLLFNDDDDELLGDVHPSTIEYHDDSDEELLPTI